MIGAIFAGMLVLLVLAVPICVVIAMISLIPYGLDATFAASPMFILRNMVSGLDSITLIAIPMFVLHHGARRHFQKTVQRIFVLHRR